MNHISILLFASLALADTAHAQGIRERIRLKRDTPVTISESQGIDVTLTLSAAQVRQVQQVVRTGGMIDAGRKILTTTISQPEANLVKVGQRVRAFAPDSKNSMFQARVTRVVPKGTRSQVEVTLSGIGRADHVNYVVEINVELGEFLSVPNEAIIEEGERRVVYVEESKGNYVPHEIVGGVQGELYTEIQKGLKAGDQVVTFGSFFVDSNYKLKLADQSVAGQ